MDPIEPPQLSKLPAPPNLPNAKQRKEELTVSVEQEAVKERLKKDEKKPQQKDPKDESSDDNFLKSKEKIE